ncbi:MAG TPA: PilZ domain-containing protein, partial [bacterium]|nr:PilZ domain-containing protein [bacterium]
LGAKSTRMDAKGFSANVSRTGIALELDPTVDVPVGASVRVTVQISGRNVALPGQVVWSRGGTDAVRAGIRLHPELTDSTSRRVFDTFVRDAESASCAR